MASIKDFIDERLNEASGVLDRVMSKVSMGKDLNKQDKKELSAAIFASRDKSSKAVKKIMSKVRNGEELTNADKKKLSAIIDASKPENMREETLDEAGPVGDVLLKQMAKRADQLAQDIPSGSTLMNRLAKEGNPKAKMVQQKIAQAQKLVDELKDTKKKIAPLKDSDMQGRKAVKNSLQRISAGLNKFQGLEREAERVMASIKGEREVNTTNKKWEDKKKEFKKRVKENLNTKRQAKMKKAKEAMSKMSGKAKGKLASFKS